MIRSRYLSFHYIIDFLFSYYRPSDNSKPSEVCQNQVLTDVTYLDIKVLSFPVLCPHVKISLSGKPQFWSCCSGLSDRALRSCILESWVTGAHVKQELHISFSFRATFSFKKGIQIHSIQGENKAHKLLRVLE